MMTIGSRVIQCQLLTKLAVIVRLIIMNLVTQFACRLICNVKRIANLVAEQSIVVCTGTHVLQAAQESEKLN